MMVLGWTWAGSDIPENIKADETGDLLTLSVARPADHDARTKMRWQVYCFDAGLDLVPVAPAHDMTLQDAEKIDTVMLSKTLQKLAKSGQLTLSLSPEIAVKPIANSGRSYLAARKSLHDTKATRRMSLETLVQQSGAESTPVRSRAGALCCDVLVPRARLDAVQSKIRTKAETTLPKTASLSVTGLWPPYNFVRMPKAISA